MSFTTDSSVTKTSKVKNTPPPTEGVVMIPPNLDLQFNAQIDKVNYNDLAINNCVSNAAIQNGKLTISKAAFTVIDAPVNMEATYAPVNIKRAYFNYHITAKEIDIQKAYKNIKLFREMATSASKVKGQVAIDYTLNGLLNDSLYPIFPTLKGGGTLTLSNAKIFGLKMLNAISKKTGKESVDNPDLSKRVINLKTTIANNIITIEKIKLRYAGFRPKFEGQVSLDGRLNLKARIGLPPFGIFGIPLSVTGTQDNPIIRYRRGRKSDELQATEADEEDKKEAAEAEAKEKVEQEAKKKQ
jgi:AsmA protein